MADKATKQIETMTADAQKAVTENMEKMTKAFEDLTAFGQQNMDALVKSSEIAAKAAEGFTSELSSFSKKSFEESVAAAKDISAAKNVTELFEKQSTYFTAVVDAMMTQATKMNEMAVASSKDVFEPITARATAAQDLMKGMTA
ncbi:MAG: phasin family protein [Rubricella sp.]